MELKNGYKQSEVGVIPQDWEAPELGGVLTSTQLGGNYKNSERETSWPLIKMGNLGRGNIKLDKQEYISTPDAPDERDRLYEDDVLFNTRNTLELVGKVAIWRNELPVAYFNSNLMRMVFDRSQVSSNRFISAMLNTPQALSSLRGIAIGTTSVAAIYGRDLVKIRIPLPTKAEQEAIAEALSDADAWIESLEQLIAKKRRIKEGSMQELLTGKRRLPGFSGAWEKKTLGDAVRIRNERIDPHRGQHSQFCIELEHLDQGTGILLGHGVTSEASSLKCLFEKGDVLFGKLRSYLKKHWFATREGVCSTEIWVLVGDKTKITPPYLYQIIQTDSFIDACSMSFGTHMPRSDWKVVRELEINLPPVTEQIAIAEVLSDMDAQIEVLAAKLSKARQIKQGMMQELLTGKTRLV